MTATDGGPALPGVDAPIRARDERGAGVSAAHAPRLRTVLALGRVEAFLLARSPPDRARIRVRARRSSPMAASTRATSSARRRRSVISFRIAT